MKVGIFPSLVLWHFAVFAACMGSYGPNCSSICPNGYFGHGCRHKCSCASTQWCDAVIGCSSKINGKWKLYYIEIFRLNRIEPLFICSVKSVKVNHFNPSFCFQFSTLEPLKNYVHMEYVYNALSRVYGINSCFNR